MTKHYESENEYNTDNNNVEMTDDNLHDFCQCCNCHVGEKDLKTVSVIGSYNVEREICDPCYEVNLDWYSLK